jgi:Zn-dependent membrane protease YugP
MIVKTFSCFKLLKAIFIVSPLTLNTSTEAVVTFSSHNFEWFVYIPLSILLLSELCLNIRIILVFVNVMFTLVTLRLAAISSEDNSSPIEPKRCSII